MITEWINEWTTSAILIRKWFQYHISWSVKPVFSSLTILLLKVYHSTNVQDVFILHPDPLCTLSTLYSVTPEADIYRLHPLDSLFPGFQRGSTNGSIGRKLEGTRKEGMEYLFPQIAPCQTIHLAVAVCHVHNSCGFTLHRSFFPPTPFTPGSGISSHTCKPRACFTIHC